MSFTSPAFYLALAISPKEFQMASRSWSHLEPFALVTVGCMWPNFAPSFCNAEGGQFFVEKERTGQRAPDSERKEHRKLFLSKTKLMIELSLYTTDDLHPFHGSSRSTFAGWTDGCCVFIYSSMCCPCIPASKRIGL